MTAIVISTGAAAVTTTQKTIKRSEPQNIPAQSTATTAVTTIHLRVVILGNGMARSHECSLKSDGRLSSLVWAAIRRFAQEGADEFLEPVVIIFGQVSVIVSLRIGACCALLGESGEVVGGAKQDQRVCDRSPIEIDDLAVDDPPSGLAGRWPVSLGDSKDRNRDNAREHERRSCHDRRLLRWSSFGHRHSNEFRSTGSNGMNSVLSVALRGLIATIVQNRPVADH